MAFAVEKLFFNIGKDVLNFISRPIALYDYKTVEVSDCSDCKFKGIQNFDKYCSEYCPIRTQSKIKAVPKYDFIRKRKYNLIYKYEPHRYTSNSATNLGGFLNAQKLLSHKTYIRLSLTQIKQVLTFYYFSNSRGYINSISKKHLAKLIGCSVKTIENNNRLFESLKLFLIGNKERGRFSVIINNYKEQYKKSEKGYIVFATELFKNILSLNNVNALRVALQGILKYDMNVVLNRETFFRLDELKGILPSYARTTTFIGKLAASLGDKINGILRNKHLVLNINEQCDGKTIKKENFDTYKNQFEGYLAERKYSKLEDSSKVVQDLISMSFEYGFNIVSLCLSESLDSSEELDNLGGHVREKIRKYLRFNDLFLSLS